MRAFRVSLPLAMKRAVACAVLLCFPAFVLFPVAQADDTPVTIRVGGTGSALGGMRLLAVEFMKANPEVHIMVLPSLGSGGGIKALAAGKIDLSVSARPLKDAEREKGLAATIYARTPFVFATRRDNPVQNVTLAEIADFYSGKQSDWPDGSPVRIVLRLPNDSDIRLIRSLSPEMNSAVDAAIQRPELHVAMNDQKNASSLEQIPGSFGAVTLAQILTEERRIKPLSLDGVKGTADALRSGDYSFAKTLFAVVGPNLNSAADAFIRFIRSGAGRTILESTGHVVPGPDDGQRM